MGRRAVITAVICLAAVTMFGSREKRQRAKGEKQVQESGPNSEDKHGFRFLFTDETLKDWRQCGPGA
jgi:hypothetical protein